MAQLDLSQLPDGVINVGASRTTPWFGAQMAKLTVELVVELLKVGLNIGVPMADRKGAKASWQC